MDPIAFGRPAASHTPPSRIPSGMPPGAVDRASADEERAEQPALAASVGALERYAAQASAVPTAPVPTAPTVPATPEPATMMPPLQGSTGSTAAPFSPARSWSSMVGQSGPGGTPAGSAADQGMSQIVDGGDVFDTSDD